MDLNLVKNDGDYSDTIALYQNYSYISNEHICRGFGFVKRNSQLYYATEKCSMSLEEYLTNRNVKVSEGLRIVKEVAEALLIITKKKIPIFAFDLDMIKLNSKKAVKFCLKKTSLVSSDYKSPDLNCGFIDSKGLVFSFGILIKYLLSQLKSKISSWETNYLLELSRNCCELDINSRYSIVQVFKFLE